MGSIIIGVYDALSRLSKRFANFSIIKPQQRAVNAHGYVFMHGMSFLKENGLSLEHIGVGFLILVMVG